jgi:hypothetical protein
MNRFELTLILDCLQHEGERLAQEAETYQNLGETPRRADLIEQASRVFALREKLAREEVQ